MSNAEVPATALPLLADVHAAFTKWLHFAPEDVEIIDVALAAAVAVHLAGESLWILVVDAPGAGKTEIIRSVRGLPNVQFLSTLSPKTLVSGFRPGGKDYSLLPKLDGKLLGIKDMTAIMDMPAEQLPLVGERCSGLWNRRRMGCPWQRFPRRRG